MSRKMSVHLFKVTKNESTQPLSDLLEKISQDDLQTRVIDIAGTKVRLEDILKPMSKGNQSRYWLLNFIKFRFENAPGKAKLDSQTEGFELAPNEGFGEETAALYDPKSNYMIIQYNHNGVRSHAIQEYFCLYGHTSESISGYELNIKLDPTTEERFLKKKYITKVQIKIAPFDILTQFRDADVSLTDMLKLSERSNSNHIELTLAAPKGESLKGKFARNFTGFLRKLMSHDSEENSRILSKFNVSGKVELEDRAEAINMLAAKLKLTIDNLQIGDDLRYTLKSRWEGLSRAANGWHQYLK